MKGANRRQINRELLYQIIQIKTVLVYEQDQGKERRRATEFFEKSFM